MNPEKYKQEIDDYNKKSKTIEINKTRNREYHLRKVKCDVCDIEICKGGQKKHQKTIKHLSNIKKEEEE